MLSTIPRHSLSPGYDVSRVIKGGWQLAAGHGHITHDKALEHMVQYARAGITTFDCADIYTGVESLIGAFLKRYRNDIREGALPEVQIHTK